MCLTLPWRWVGCIVPWNTHQEVHASYRSCLYSGARVCRGQRIPVCEVKARPKGTQRPPGVELLRKSRVSM